MRTHLTTDDACGYSAMLDGLNAVAATLGVQVAARSSPSILGPRPAPPADGGEWGDMRERRSVTPPHPWEDTLNNLEFDVCEYNHELHMYDAVCGPPSPPLMFRDEATWRSEDDDERRVSDADDRFSRAIEACLAGLSVAEWEQLEEQLEARKKAA